MTMQALLDSGDEVLIPAPDYPLWTAMTSFAGARRCTTAATTRTAGSPTSKTSGRR
jgi:aspartate/methionine/tyrosine aminotransferase